MADPWQKAGSRLVLRLHQFRTITVLGRIETDAGLETLASGSGSRASTSERMRDVVKRISRSPPKPRGASPTPAVGSLALDEMLDLNAAAPLRQALLARRGADLAVDASAVQHLGAQCAQVLASAALTWAADGTVLTFAAASESFAQCARLLGLHSTLTPESSLA